MCCFSGHLLHEHLTMGSEATTESHARSMNPAVIPATMVGAAWLGCAGPKSVRLAEQGRWACCRGPMICRNHLAVPLPLWQNSFVAASVSSSLESPLRLHDMSPYLHRRLSGQRAQVTGGTTPPMTTAYGHRIRQPRCAAAGCCFQIDRV